MSSSHEVVTALIELGIDRDKAVHAASMYGDVERACAWCFDEGENWTPAPVSIPAPAPPLLPAPYAAEGSVDKPIDMTLAGEPDEDEELRRAIAASMMDHPGVERGGPGTMTPAGQTGVAFGPSTKEATAQNTVIRPLDGWDPSPPPFSSAEDKQLNEAMLASFHDSLPGTDINYDPREPGPKLPGAPIAFYNPDPGMAYATSVMQGLFALSSFHEILALSYPNDIPQPPLDSGLSWLTVQVGTAAWKNDLQMLSRKFSQAAAAEAAGAENGAVKEFELVGYRPSCLWPCEERNIDPEGPASKFFEQVDELTAKALAHVSIPDDLTISTSLESLFYPRVTPLQYFNFQTMQPLFPNVPFTPHAKLSIHSHSNATSSVHRAVANQLWCGSDDGKYAIVGSGPHALAVFVTYPKTIPLGGRVPFELEEKIYVDRYLQRNFQQVVRLRASEGVLCAEEKELMARRSKLTTVQGKDVRAHLANVIGYYEALAKPVDDADLRERSARTLTKLRGILQELDDEVARIGERVKEVMEKRESLYDGPDLRKCPFELKAVHMNNGLHTVGCTYSYVRHGDKWWKVVDGSSSEVTWEVIKADLSGLHLGAGPWGLMYERGSEWIEEPEPGVEVEQEVEPMDVDPAVNETATPPAPALAPDADAPADSLAAEPPAPPSASGETLKTQDVPPAYSYVDLLL